MQAHKVAAPTALQKMLLFLGRLEEQMYSQRGFSLISRLKILSTSELLL